MLDHALEAVDLLGKSSRRDLSNNRMMQLALTRLMEIIGEAANRVSSKIFPSSTMELYFFMVPINTVKLTTEPQR